MPKIAASHSAVISEKKDEKKKRKKKQKRRVISTKLLSLRNAAKNREIRKKEKKYGERMCIDMSSADVSGYQSRFRAFPVIGTARR